MPASNTTSRDLLIASCETCPRIVFDDWSLSNGGLIGLDGTTRIRFAKAMRLESIYGQ